MRQLNNSNDIIFYPHRCTFYIDSNNLVNSHMVSAILEKIEDDAITKLNEVIKGITFYVGGKQWHINQKGYLKASTYEYNFNNGTLIVYLSKIFNLGYERWRRLSYGSLKRFIWESFCYEFIMMLSHITKLDTQIARKAKNYYLNKHDEFTLIFLKDLFNYEGENLPRINYIKIINTIWIESLPESLGFLNVLYARKISKLKTSIPVVPNFMKIRIFNELRKLKLKHRYEYNLSELINYCIHSEHFEKLFMNNSQSYQKLQNEFYGKAKRIILKFFKQYNITHELFKYLDSADRTHYFLTHKTFERVKSVCLQKCIQKIKNKLLEEYGNFRTYYSKCPICEQSHSNHQICEEIFFSSKYSYFKEILLEKMKDDEFDSLNTDDNFFGIPCEPCFQLIHNIQGRFSELNQLQKFVVKYGCCPVCGANNHRDYLISFYNDENKREIRDYLVNNIYLSEKLEEFKINIGIPCCNCFEQFFDKDSNIAVLDVSNIINEI